MWQKKSSVLITLLLASNITSASAAEKITIEIAEDQIGGYARSAFKHWIDADRDGCNTRYEVLISEAKVAPKVGSRCALTGGKWRSSYDGKIFTSPTGLDIDHMVPLAEAWRSGAWAWSPDERMEFANDLEFSATLIAVTAGANRSKGDRDVAKWLPAKAKCRYIANWIAVKSRFALTVDLVEGEFLRSKLVKCNITNVEIIERLQ